MVESKTCWFVNLLFSFIIERQSRYWRTMQPWWRYELTECLLVKGKVSHFGHWVKVFMGLYLKCFMLDLVIGSCGVVVSHPACHYMTDKDPVGGNLNSFPVSTR